MNNYLNILQADVTMIVIIGLVGGIFLSVVHKRCDKKDQIMPTMLAVVVGTWAFVLIRVILQYI